MPADHLRRDALYDLRNVETVLLGGDLSVEHDLKQKVAQLAREVRVVAALDRLHHLVGLLDRHRLEAAVGLLPVPGAPCGRTQPRDEGDEGLERGAGAGALVAHGRGL
jgi:hypothetical protein